ncbi:MAG TPA: PEP-CTERM sorting domain-containing protein [Chthoniobacter sp.]|nr:PEP-CTERM sorting domain-containing protein [Chthoniobacter sp.]
MSPRLRPSHLGIALLCSVVAGQHSARATLIALDNFETTASTTSGFYLTGNINGQSATAGTSGYFAGTASGNQSVGWQSGTAAFLAQVGGLTNPLLVSPATANDGSFLAAGNANARLQYRDLASISAPASSDYYFSLLLSESVISYTGTVYAGLGSSRPTGANATIPANGFNIGFNNGALSLFYNNGGASYATQSLLATPTANQTYMVEVHLTLAGTTATLIPFVYNSSGALLNTPASQAVTGIVNSTTDIGAFQSWISSDFNTQSPSKVVFDAFRFGTAESDVISVPEPTATGLLALSAVGLIGFRRKR